ncbi:TetR/AcrR family transcriptional regulator C-terminal domain-containing protein [Actinocrispum sp. NPDC049592]|uniref:TetR/AcrR family transcriptional regulator C-terminal domain-containing protein n=1 Tax=Actinocrispum sp. NPDC049592 TaxID=3154835 RepID=UPI0034415A85
METGAPYLRIVGEIRERIASGRLRPGDRVPSTRQITQQWGVAMATATKVISTLRDEGLVDTKPGAGTVVRSAQSQQDIGRDRVIRAGIALADAEGLGAVSMRRLATDLGVATMSLYRYVSSKDDLVVFMADTAFGEVPWPGRPVAGWRPRLELAARLMWTVCRRHPWVAEVLSMTRPRGTPQLLVYAEWVLSTLHSLGLPMDDMMYIHLTLFGHIKAIALSLSAETQARQDTGITSDEWMRQQEAEFRAVVAGGSFPTMEYLTTQEFDQDLDRMFEYGLRMVLDGLDTYVNAHNYTAKNDHAG